MKYKHVQEYLEDVFAGKGAVSKEMIIQAKREFRKLYLAEYHRAYRNKNIQVSFRIPIGKYKAIQALAKKQKIKVPALIRQWVMEKQGNDTSTDNRNYQRYLLRLMDLTEEAIEESDLNLLPEILLLLKQMQEEYQ